MLCNGDFALHYYVGLLDAVLFEIYTLAYMCYKVVLHFLVMYRIAGYFRRQFIFGYFEEAFLFEINSW